MLATWRTFLAPVIAKTLLSAATAGDTNAQEDLGIAQEPTWSILKLDSNGRPVLVEEGGSEINVEVTEKPIVTAPTEEQIRNIDKQKIERGQLMLLDAKPKQIAALNSEGYRTIEEIRLPTLGVNVVRVAIPPGTSEENAIRKIKRDHPGLIVDVNTIMDLSAGSEKGTYANKYVGWGDVPRSCGDGIRMGMIDGGVYPKAKSLAGQKVKYRSFIKKDRKAAGFDHGTAVAVILVGKPGGGRLGGLLPGAMLYAAGIFENRNGKEHGNLSNMLKAAEWLASKKVKVVNMSIAGSSNAVLTFVINKLMDKGIAVVAAAGNFGAEAKPAWPAAHPKVIAVTAIDHTLDVYRYANQGQYVDFAAPGVGLLTETPRRRKQQSGTSFAAPYITAMIAVHIKHGFPTDTDRLRASLKRFVKDLGSPGRDPTYGWGLVRLRARC